MCIIAAVCVAAYFVAAFRAQCLIPAASRVVIMSSGVTYADWRCVAVWQVASFIQRVKCKLQNLHAWESKFISQSFHFRGDNAQIFCNNWKVSLKSITDCGK